MMLPIVYRVENVYRIRYALIATVIVSAILCAYFSTTAVLDARRVWRTEKSLRSARIESAELERRARAVGIPRGDRTVSGGTEVFAVYLSDWAENGGIRIESLTPQGIPVDADVNMNNVPLGKWRAAKIIARGRGRFESVMALLDRLHYSPVPIQLDSFSLEGWGDGSDGSVLFELTMTTYEPGRETKS